MKARNPAKLHTAEPSKKGRFFMKELMPARAFIASFRGRRLRPSFLITAAAVTVGTGFLGLALWVDDSDVEKLETLLVTAARRADSGPFILEERAFACRYHGAAGRVTDIRRLRVLGVATAGDRVVPQVDRFVRPELLARLQQSAAPAVILSEKLARSLFAGADAAGQTLTILRPGEAPLRLEVLGTFALARTDAAHNLLITSLATVQTLLEMEGEVRRFGIVFDDPHAAPGMIARWRRALWERGLMVSDCTVVAGGDLLNAHPRGHPGR